MIFKYLKLEGYNGLKHGINVDTFELKDIPSGIILLNGSNGCGKSTTLNALHIFSDSKQQLIQNEDGSYIPAKKELIVEHNNNTYHIIHQYSKTGSKKSFITKNENEELNANGNVATFEAVVLKEFGIENNTISNSIIGVSELSFIDLTSTERKKEISTLLPSISEYEKTYKLTNDNLNACKKQIQMLSQLIAEHGSIEELNNTLNDIITKIQPIEEEIDKLNNDNITNGKNLAVFNSNLNNLNLILNELQTYINNNTIKYNNTKSKVEAFNIKKPENTDINVLISKKEVYNNNLNNALNERNNIHSKLNNMNNQWSNYQKDIKTKADLDNNYNSLLNNIKSLELEINQLNDELKQLKNKEIKNYYDNEVLQDVIRIGKDIKEELTSIDNIYTHSINNLSSLEAYANYQEYYNKIAMYEKQVEEAKRLESVIELFTNISNNVNKMV